MKTMNQECQAARPWHYNERKCEQSEDPTNNNSALWQLAQNVLAPQNIDRLGTAWYRDMLNIYVRKVSWQNLSVLRPRFNPLIHFYSKSNFPIFHQVLYRNLQIRPQKWVSHWFLTKKKKKLYPKKFQIAKVIPKKRNFSTFDFIFQIWEPC